MEQGGKCTKTKRNLKPFSEHQTRESVHYNVFNGLVRKGEAKKKKKKKVRKNVVVEREEKCDDGCESENANWTL